MQYISQTVTGSSGQLIMSVASQPLSIGYVQNVYVPDLCSPSLDSVHSGIGQLIDDLAPLEGQQQEKQQKDSSARYSHPRIQFQVAGGM